MLQYALPIPAEERPLAGVRTPPSAARVELSRCDIQSLKAFAKGDPGEVAALIEDTRQFAEALSGPEGDGARVRLLSVDVRPR